MILPVVVFTVIFFILSAFMVAISFHVYRFRYPHDSTGIIFIMLAVVFILIAIMTYLLFDYSTAQTSTTQTPQLSTDL